jgi:hypothetical protein
MDTTNCPTVIVVKNKSNPGPVPNLHITVLRTSGDRADGMSCHGMYTYQQEYQREVVTLCWVQHQLYITS